MVQLFWARSAAKQGEHRRRDQGTGGYPVGFVLFHWEPQDRQYVRENESRVRVGSQRANDTETGGELIGKVGRAEKNLLALAEEAIILIQ